MSAFLLTDAGDYAIVNGSMALTDNATTPGQEVLQQIRSNLRFCLGEYFLDVTVGIPYFQVLFQQGIDDSVIEGYLRQAILDTDGVNGLSAFTYTPGGQGRIGQVTFTAQTVKGPVTATETI